MDKGLGGPYCQPESCGEDKNKNLLSLLRTEPWLSSPKTITIPNSHLAINTKIKQELPSTTQSLLSYCNSYLDNVNL
jgi:hypothetical protein